MNKPILTTPFNGQTLKATGPSVDSGFASVDEVVAVMGDDHFVRTPRIVVYGDITNRVVFSDIPFQVDAVNNNG